MEFNFDPVAFSIFGIEIRWYAIIIIAGMLLGTYFAKKEFIRRGFDEDFIYDILFVIIPIGIIGARLWYVLFKWEFYSQNPIQILNIRGGGLAIHGGIIFGALALYFYSKKHMVPFLDMTDILTPSLALAQGIGRWGNFINQEAHGGPTDLPWGIIIDGVKVHPTFLYESLGDIIIFLFLINAIKRNPDKGKISAAYLISYGVLRYFVEGLRTDSLYWGPFRTAQLISLAFIVLGIALFFYANKKNLPPYFRPKNTKKEKEAKIIKFQ
ncbi:prolipoprotein diacylglyceryl transferase [Anaerococcus sp. Marseille-Q5996]|uniref:prolipoprotein diacylglyceryl transferase n=1 Tax=Anaerococcus sp. Marseille-Q5996 TaxID=2972769 RepID=UPI0021C76C23|nr:prolipoprotein diacylglyceryl transferase [Anaerococcus sp. Marseille-Q5996]